MLKQVSFILLITSLASSYSRYGHLQSENKPLPVKVTCRKALITRSYVLQIQNNSNESLNLWIKAKGKTSPFVLSGNKMLEFGWAQGYHFDANNLFLIGANGYDTIKQQMPDIELSPWRIGLSKDGGGLNASFSKSFLQEQLGKRLKLPMIKKASNVLDISLNQPPQIILEENSDRIFSTATLQASLLSVIEPVPLTATVSFFPIYDQSNGEISVSQIRVENINMNLLSKEWFDQTSQIVNEILPTVFDKYIIYHFEQQWLIKIAKAVNLRTKVIDGRLEIIIL